MTSYLFLAEGFEEIEALATVDIMRRGGMDVKTVSITDDALVAGAHGITVVADLTLSEAELDNADWLIVPGGLPGSTNVAACKPVTDAIAMQVAKGGNVAAICAAPAMVFGPLGILDGKEATGYPGTEGLRADVKWTGKQVAQSGNIITGQAPGAAYKFALAIVAAAKGEIVAETVASEMYI
ncbi:MAG: DJ-1/PfpI family protein [Muribaculaceae bacterium]|nr:DJ-1/PfpI family protein [Muribaculaceae bacterium]